MSDKPKWELVVDVEITAFSPGDPKGYEATLRLLVPGGWLYKTQLATANENLVQSMVFVPNPSIAPKGFIE